MITIIDFLKLECSEHTKKLMIETIDQLNDAVEEKILIFNIYSIVTHPKRNEVIINEDICPDENPYIIEQLDKFYLAVKNFQVND